MAAFDVLDQAFVEGRYDRGAHPMRRFVGRAFIVLLVVVIGVAAYVWRYQPLSAGSIFGVRSDPPAANGGAGIAYAPGLVIDVLFTVDNTGLVPVRVTGVGSELRPITYSYGVRQLPPRATGYDEAQAIAFTPFTLRPGQARTLDLRYTLKDCGPAGSSWANRIVREQTVRYDVYGGLSRTAHVALVRPLVIMGMPAC